MRQKYGRHIFRQPQLFADGLLHQVVERNRLVHFDQRHDITDAKALVVFENRLRPGQLHITRPVLFDRVNMRIVLKHGSQFLAVGVAFLLFMKYLDNLFGIVGIKINFAGRSAFVDQRAEADFSKRPSL